VLRLLLLTLVGVALLAACGGEDEAAAPAPAVEGFELIESTALVAGRPLDPRYTCDGDDVSPALGWQGTPEGTRELAVLVEDPDADGFTHWLAYGIPPTTTGLPELIPAESEVSVPAKLLQGENDAGRIGWSGPCPPEGEGHRYVFHLLALDAALGLEPGAGRDAFDEAIAGHVVAEARLEVTYARSG
jgi:Raf kinase inhibitor-like YbhB/YbcL family protein